MLFLLCRFTMSICTGRDLQFQIFEDYSGIINYKIEYFLKALNLSGLYTKPYNATHEARCLQ